VKIARCSCGAEWKVKKLMPHHACEDCKAERRKNWQAAHPAVMLACRKAWRQRNLERVRCDVKAWKKAHPDRCRVHDTKAKRKYRKKQRLLNKQLIASLPCLECGVSHSAERRQAVIRRALPATREEIKEAWPCFWRGVSGQARLAMDLKAMGAYSHKWIWQLRREAA